VVDSGPADGYWWIREINYEPAQGLARWRFIKARPHECLDAEPSFVLATEVSLIDLGASGAYLDVPFTIERICCDRDVSVTVTEAPDPGLVAVSLPGIVFGEPVPSPFSVRLQPLAPVEYDQDFTLGLQANGCGGSMLAVPGVIRAAPFVFGNCLHFDGINDYMQVPYHAGTNPGSDDFWFSFWVRSYDNTGLDRPNRRWVHFFNGSVVQMEIRLSSGTHPQLIFQFTGSGGTGTVGTTTLLSATTLNRWFHVIVAKIGPHPANWKIWVDGVSYAVTSSGATDVGIAPAATNFRIGGGAGTALNHWPGSLDEIQYYIGSQPSPADVAFLYNAGSGNRPPLAQLPFLRGRWKLDEVQSGPPAVNVAPDTSGQGNHGTLVNFGTRTLPGDSNPAWRSH
ncbi:MAG: hypothetical protein KF690_11245, partial [Bacteroidetes bacterium]|nr:hypothetical protein [Bacteroidota bacterium]